MKNVFHITDQDFERANDPVQNYLDKDFHIKALTLITAYLGWSYIMIDDMIFDLINEQHFIANSHYLTIPISFLLIIQFTLYFAKKKRKVNRPWAKELLS